MTWEVKKCQKCNREFRSEKDFFQNTSRWMVCSSGNLWFNCGCNSTLFIPKGKFAWYSPAKHMTPENATVFNKISKSNSVPHIDSGIYAIQEKLNQCENVVEVLPDILKEPTVATQLIKIATNIQRENDADSGSTPGLKHALTIIGKDRLYSLLVPAFLGKMNVASSLFISSRFWDDAFEAGMISNRLVKFFGIEAEPEFLFVNTCLANIGLLAHALFCPELVDQALKLMSDPKHQCTWEVMEEQADLYSLSTMGEIAGAIWGFSEETIEVAGNHSKIELGNTAQNPVLIKLASLSILIQYWISGYPHLVDNQLLWYRTRDLNIEEQSLMHFIENVSGLSEST